MLRPVTTLIDAATQQIVEQFEDNFPSEVERARSLRTYARLALEILANTDSAYHDVEHTIHVALVGQDILIGRRQLLGDVGPEEWHHFLIALLFHDVGYVRGAIAGDRPGAYVINEAGDTICPPEGATDAYLTPHHVDRSKLFAQQRAGRDTTIHSSRIISYIERTRFPVPDVSAYQSTDDLPGLARAADLIGQLGDSRYLIKLARLFTEFQETGQAEGLGYANAGQMRRDYPQFFWQTVAPYVEDALRYLRHTQSGQAWVASLYANVFVEEHGAPAFGPERRLRQTDIAPKRRQTDQVPTSTAAAFLPPGVAALGATRR